LLAAQKFTGFLKRLRRAAVCCLWVGLALITALALLSFSPFDASWRLQTVPELPIHNLLGVFGANLAQAVFFIFGSVGWLLPVALVVEALAQLYPQHRRFGGAVRLLFSLLLMLLGSIALSLIFELEGFQHVSLLPSLFGLVIEGVAAPYLWGGLIAVVLLLSAALWMLWPIDWQVSVSAAQTMFSSKVALRRLPTSPEAKAHHGVNHTVSELHQSGGAYEQNVTQLTGASESSLDADDKTANSAVLDFIRTQQSSHHMPVSAPSNEFSAASVYPADGNPELGEQFDSDPLTGSKTYQAPQSAPSSFSYEKPSDDERVWEELENSAQLNSVGQTHVDDRFALAARSAYDSLSQPHTSAPSKLKIEPAFDETSQAFDELSNLSSHQAGPDQTDLHHQADQHQSFSGSDGQGATEHKPVKPKSRAFATAQHRAELSPLPQADLLDTPALQQLDTHDPEKLAYLSTLLQEKLQEFGVKSEVISALPGPVITRFEVDLAPGVKASKVSGISRDLARSLSMATVRVVEVIPGKPYIGIEVPNQNREMVAFKQMMQSQQFLHNKNELCVAIGKNISGKPTVFDLAKAPHLLVAGTTGSGKSVTVNVMLLSMLFKYTPEELRLILIDPKQLELANYADIPHLLTPVVTDMKDAASALSWCVKEMERRYQLMAFLKVRKLADYNKKLTTAEQNGEDFLDPTWRPNDSVSVDRAPRLKPMPFIVVIADEFADMIMQVGKQAEELITRLAQKSRAAGIHLVLATQRPSVDVITGLIKANIPTRMALRVNSRIDSRTILDQGGAEDMLGHGDMLFLGPGKIEPERVHSAFVSDDEVNRVCDAWRARGAPDYVDEVLDAFDENSVDNSSGGGGTSGEEDDLYDQAVSFVMESKKVSISSIQRKFSIGFNRAARIVDGMQEAGLVSGADKTGKREILM
jgi:S-DNA-T family DNA segregation ATPase FtsK/SpoIIIE